MSKKIYYTDDQLQQMGLDLATKHNEIEALKENKKADVDLWNEKIKIAQAEADDLAIRITTGFYEISDEDLQGRLDMGSRSEFDTVQ